MTPPGRIRRLLVANRGEIAVRIARSARHAGIEIVAVYAPSDASAPHVRAADTAVALHGEGAAGTYLDAGQLLAAAARTGADAVHPGYGFLSERASFATAVLDAGLTWVGPPPAAIAAMGDKLSAKRRMADAGVPTLPTVEIPAGAFAGSLPAGVRYPVMVKASAGGGGKGMRVVEEPGALADAVAAARREAEAAFGDPTVFVEPYVPDARHVEIQVLADDHGHVVHCFERDCSIQRRHQKVIEEAPSPALDDALRAQMGDAAVVAARAVGYRSAGTVEFVLDAAGGFWFLEVNTRLQVEHPVTEAVTGLDLVREQLRIAAGLPLSVTQDDLRISGHAVEARLYAEDPAAGWLPATGTLLDWAPADQPAVRWDAGVGPGSVVGVEWDPLLAKVIAHAPTREEAALRLASALARSRIRGVTTNRDFLVAALRHPTFLAGQATTSFAERPDVARARDVTDAEVTAAAVTAALAGAARRRAGATVLASLPSGWRTGSLPDPGATFDVAATGGDGGAGRSVTVGYRAARDGTWSVRVDGGAPRTARFAISGDTSELELDGLLTGAHVLADAATWWVQTAAGDLVLHERPRFPPAAVTAVAGGLVAPMPGRVIDVAVVAGSTVAAGDLLVIVEAMKMEHRVVATDAGVVAAVRVAAGDQVRSGDLLVVVDPAERGAADEAVAAGGTAR